MRFIRIPRPAILKAFAQKDQEPPKYSFFDYLQNDLLKDPRWFSSLEWQEALDELEKFDGAKEGDVIELTDKAWEKLEQIVRETPIGGSNKLAMRWLVKAVTHAEKIKPEKIEKAVAT